MTAPAVQTEIYGRGFAFPFEFDTMTGGVKKSRGLQSVQDAFVFILGTFPPERFMDPLFGSRLSLILFELETTEAEALARTFVAEATNLEPRIEKLMDARIIRDPSDDHRLLINIEYRPIRQTTTENLVLPLLRG